MSSSIIPSLFSWHFQHIGNYLNGASFKSLNKQFGSERTKKEDKGIVPKSETETVDTIAHWAEVFAIWDTSYEDRLKFTLFRYKKIFDVREDIISQTRNKGKLRQLSRLDKTLLELRRIIFDRHSSKHMFSLYPYQIRYYIPRLERDLRDMMRLFPIKKRH